MKYNTTSLSAKAGKVSIDFTNMAPLGHNVTIESASGAVVWHHTDSSRRVEDALVEPQAGTYKFFCSVPGHRMAGMEGTLTVK